jgi:signal transduction histidine kinase
MTTFLLLAFWFLAFTARVMGDVTNLQNIEVDTSGPYVSPTNGLGSWIWAAKTTDGQLCQFWNSFEIPASNSVATAQLVMTVDNEFTLYMDGRELGRGAEWRELFVFNLTPLLSPGKHVLAIKAFNSFGPAGMLFGLQIMLKNGQLIHIQSDRSWRLVPDGVRHWDKMTEEQADWVPATIVMPFGGGPYWTQPINVNRMPSLQPIKVYFWQTGWFQISLLLLSALIFLISFRLVAQLAFHQKERWLLQRERARIARDIHDDIGARMTQLVLHGEVAQSGLPAGSEIRLKLTHICEEARGLLSTMDEILWAVNPRRDTLRDFTSYVCNYAQEYLKPTQIQCLLEVDPEISAEALNLPLRRSLLMAIKEAFNNAVKHSNATEVRLQILWHGQKLVVAVQDNGRGFDPAIVKSERNGITSMTQRITELGGSCEITSQPGKGCRIEFAIPLRHPQRRLWDKIWNKKNPAEYIDETRTI